MTHSKTSAPFIKKIKKIIRSHLSNGMEDDIDLMLGFDVNPIFISNQKSRLSNGGGLSKYNVEFWHPPHFFSNQNTMSIHCWRLTSSKHWALMSTQFSFWIKSQCLSSGGNLSKSNIFDDNCIFSNQNATSLQCWHLTSSKHWVLTSTWFSFQIKTQRLSSVRSLSESNIGFGINAVFISNQNSTSVQC